MKHLLLLFFSLTISSYLFSQENLLTHKTDDFSISYPENWSYSDQKPNPMVQAVFYSPEASQEKDSFRENVNLTVEDLKGREMDLNEYTNTSLESVKSQIPSAKIITQTDTKVNGFDAKSIVWSADFGTIYLKFKQISTIINEKAYIITYTSTVEEFDDYIEIGDQILSSLIIH